MSLTFSIEDLHEEHGYDLPCPTCGLSTIAAMALPATAPTTCEVCGGYGGPADEHMPRPQFELNVSNVNGALLLEALDLDEEPSGAVEPTDLLRELAIKYQRRGDVFPLPQADAYWAQLRRIATKARQYSRRVVWS